MRARLLLAAALVIALVAAVLPLVALADNIGGGP